MANDHEARLTALEKDVQEVKTRLDTLEKITAPKDVGGMSDYILSVTLEEQCREMIQNRTASLVNTDETR